MSKRVGKIRLVAFQPHTVREKQTIPLKQSVWMLLLLLGRERKIIQWGKIKDAGFVHESYQNKTNRVI